MGLFSNKHKKNDNDGFFSIDRNIDEFMMYMVLHPEEDPVGQYLDSKKRFASFNTERINKSQRDALVKLKGDMTQTANSFPQSAFKEYTQKMRNFADSLRDEHLSKLTVTEFTSIIATSLSLIDSLENAIHKHDAVLDYIEELRTILFSIMTDASAGLSQNTIKKHAPRIKILIGLIESESIIKNMDPEIYDILSSARLLIE